MTEKDRMTIYARMKATGSAKVPIFIIDQIRDASKAPPGAFCLRTTHSLTGKCFSCGSMKASRSLLGNTPEALTKSLLLMDSCGSHDLLSDPQVRMKVITYPNCRSEHQLPDVGIVVADKLQDNRRLFGCRTEILPSHGGVLASEGEREPAAGWHGGIIGRSPVP